MATSIPTKLLGGLKVILASSAAAAVVDGVRSGLTNSSVGTVGGIFVVAAGGIALNMCGNVFIDGVRDVAGVAKPNQDF